MKTLILAIVIVVLCMGLAGIASVVLLFLYHALNTL